MKLKGHAKIELTDVHTGEKQVVEHDNMITNAVNDLCNPIGLLSPGIAIPSMNYDKPLVESLFGGLMLWEEPLNDDPDDYIFPNGVNCVGYACDKANAGVNNMMGTYNASESGYQEDGSHKKVWDFSTAQANGTIASLALVPTIAGNAGWGVTEYDDSLGQPAVGYIAEEISVDYTDRAYSCDANLFIKDGYLYQIKYCNLQYSDSYQSNHISRNGGKLILQKVLYPTNKISLFAKCKYLKYVEEIEIQLPTEFTSQISTSNTFYYGVCNYDDASESINIIMLNNSVLDSGGKIVICKVNISDFSCTTYEITVQEKVCFDRIVYNNYRLLCLIVGSKVVLKVYGQKKFIIVDINSNETIEVVTPEDMYLGSARNNFLYMVNNGGTKPYVLDITDGTLRRINAYSYGTSNEKYNPFARIQQYQDVKFVGNKIYSMYGLNCLMAFHHIMLTKNNLSSPVTKTASQTMKITYTISKET